jgi:hypothetical protein
MHIYLAQTRPERFEFDPADIWLELLGARGEFRIGRLGMSEFIFRKSILEGFSIGDAAEKALGADTAFEPGKALAALFIGGLVTAVATHARGGEG